MQYRVQYNPDLRYPDPGEINSGELLVETAGYISAEQRIINIMRAGQRLQETRREMYDYDYEDDIDEDNIYDDPTRDPGYDMADATQTSLSLKSRERVKKAESIAPVDDDSTKIVPPVDPGA